MGVGVTVGPGVRTGIGVTVGPGGKTGVGVVVVETYGPQEKR